MEDPSVTFEATTIKYKCSISSEIIKVIPVMVIALTKNYKESQKKKYIYGGELISVNAIKLYFSWKKSVVMKNQDLFLASLQSISSLTAIDWKNAMYLAVHLADFDFFDEKIGPEFPSLEFMIEEIPNLPSEGSIRYVEQYLTEIFYNEKSWKTKREESENKDSLEYYRSEHTVEDYKATLEMVKIATNLIWGDLHPEILISMDFDKEKLKKANIDMDYYNQIMDKWENYGRCERERIVYAYCDYIVVTIGDNFYRDWTTFFTLQPVLAKLIWESMDRQELLKVTNVSFKKRGTMSKLDFIQIQEYIKKATPKSVPTDPIELKLKEELRSAQQGERFGANSRYISSEEVEMARSKLENYKASRKLTEQKKESIANRDKNALSFNKRKISINIQMLNRK
jgi:hypothetical protein